MVNCLLCGNHLEDTVSLSQMLACQPIRAKLICQSCEAQFSYIKAPNCQHCGRHLEIKESNIAICSDCQVWREQKQWYFKNSALIEYNPHFRQWLILLKGKGDLRLANYFKKKLQCLRRQSPAYIWVPIPSSPQNKQRRGFDQTALILKACKLPSQQLLIMNEMNLVGKQALKSKQERMARHNPFTITTNTTAIPSKIILFDDVYTTGTTLFQATQVLKKAGVKDVRGITLAK